MATLRGPIQPVPLATTPPPQFTSPMPNMGSSATLTFGMARMLTPPPASSSMVTSVQMTAVPVVNVNPNIPTVRMDAVKIVTDPMQMRATNPPILDQANCMTRDYLTSVHHTRPVVQGKLDEALADTMTWVANVQDASTDFLKPSDILATFLHQDEKLLLGGLPIEYKMAKINPIDPHARPEEIPYFPQPPHSQGFMFLTDQRVLLMATSVSAAAHIHRFLGYSEIFTTQVEQPQGCLCFKQKNPNKPNKYKVVSESAQTQWFFPIPLERFHHFYFDGVQVARATDTIEGQVPDCCGLGLCKLGDKQWRLTGHQPIISEEKGNHRRVLFALDLPPWNVKTNLVVDVLPTMSMRALADWLSAFQVSMVRCKRTEQTVRCSVSAPPSPGPVILNQSTAMAPPLVMRMT